MRGRDGTRGGIRGANGSTKWRWQALARGDIVKANQGTSRGDKVGYDTVQ